MMCSYYFFAMYHENKTVGDCNTSAKVVGFTKMVIYIKQDNSKYNMLITLITYYLSEQSSIFSTNFLKILPVMFV